MVVKRSVVSKCGGGGQVECDVSGVVTVVFFHNERAQREPSCDSGSGICIQIWCIPADV